MTDDQGGRLSISCSGDRVDWKVLGLFLGKEVWMMGKEFSGVDRFWFKNECSVHCFGLGGDRDLPRIIDIGVERFFAKQPFLSCLT